MPVINRVPYQNLILTGYMGVGKTAVGRAIANQLEIEFYDLENEIQLREGMSAENIRSLLGETRLRTVEAELIHELSLVRQSVIAISGPALIEPQNAERLRATGPILCLTAALNEVLRRLHVSQGARFHTPDARAVILGRLKREMTVLQLNYPQLDTTGLSIETVTQRAIDFWMAQAET
ncbi:MAG: hypothetical protein CUN55_01320 [Phototrophicales bacterium]|nr:MAG: hypothetical protein CUN55_01320 [Phototrophicales bacterium]